MTQNLKRNWILVSKLTWETWRILAGALKSLKNLHINWCFLSKVYNVWAKKVLRNYVWWQWRLMQNLKEIWLVLSKMTWGIRQIFKKLKNSDIIPESKNGRTESKQKNETTRSTRCSGKTFFYFRNKRIAQLTKLFTHVYSIPVIKI